MTKKAESLQRPRTEERTVAVAKATLARSNDIDHYDALTIIRDRLFGLRCAIKGAGIADAADRSGLQQIAADIVESLDDLCAAFANERGVQISRR